MRSFAAYIWTLFVIGQLWSQSTDAPVRVAVLLPFHIDKGGSDPFNQAMLDYWAGIKTAANELANNGIPCEIDLRNFQVDSQFLASVAGKLWLNQHDLIIGPVYPKQLSSMDNDNPISKPWISPLAPYAFREATNGISMFTNDSLRVVGMCNEFNRCFPNHKIIVISPSNPKEGQQSKANRDRLMQLLGNKATEYIWNPELKNSFPYLESGSDSFLLVYTDQFSPEAQQFISKRAMGLKNSYAVGCFDWLEAQGKFKLSSSLKAKMIYPSPVALQFNDSIVGQISYQLAISEWGDPSKYAYLGYDQFLFLIGHYSTNPSMNPMQYGQNNEFPTYQGCIQNIRLYPTGYGLGNAGMRLVRVDGEFQIPIEP